MGRAEREFKTIFHRFTYQQIFNCTDPQMRLHHGDLTDSTCLVHIISKVLPSEVYNLGAQSHVKVSFDMSEYTADVDAVGTLRLLDAIRTCGLAHLVRFYQVLLQCAFCSFPDCLQRIDRESACEPVLN